MPDIVNQRTRSRMMSGIRHKNTRPEIEVRRRLHAMGFRYRLHAEGLPGRPDIVLGRYRTVIFVNGCFWHRHVGCPLAYDPKSRVEFWQTKFRANVDRDARVIDQLLNLGWMVEVIWECETRSSRLEERLDRLREGLGH